MTGVTLQIDGLEVAASGDETILTAAHRAGLGGRVPTLCHLQGSAPEGGCRLCLVQVAGEERPLAACSARVRQGMVVATSTAEIETLRRDMLALLLRSYPGAAAANDNRGGRAAGEFRTLLTRYGLHQAPGLADGTTRHQSTPQSHPYLRYDADRCIVCRRCLHVCEDLQGQFVYGIGGRGEDVHLIFGEDEQFSNSPCVSCGACVEVCPTGALYDTDRIAALPAGSETVRSTCGYCGVGCNVDISTYASAVVRISGTRESVVNAGHLCAKGRYAHGWARSAERLTRPLLRVHDDWREISWPEAMRWAADRINEIRRSHGPDALGIMTSSRSTNEAAYLFQKLFRTTVGTNNVDCCARVCHSSTALALTLATGTGAASACFDDIEGARTIVIAGANPTEAHPVIGARIKQAARRGARLIVIDPRDIELVRYATMTLPMEPGTNVPLFNALALVILQEELYDRAYIAGRTEGFELLERFLQAQSLTALARSCAQTPEGVREAAHLIAGEGPALFVTGLGLSELSEGTSSVLALANIALLTGSIGARGAGMLPLRGQNNVQGNADMGSAPDWTTGYQPVAEPAVRERLKGLWGTAPPQRAGRTIPQMLAGARDGSVRALWIQGEDVVQSDPNEGGVIEALRNLDLLVVQELFMSETAQYAQLVLPAAGALEQDGTFTNGERRIQRVRRAVPPPGEARPDWQIATDLGRALGAGWSYQTPSAVMDEIAMVAPQLFGGVSYERLDSDGLQWPCSTATDPGTARLHCDAFVRGRGRFSVVEYQPTPERRSASLPYVLITGRVLQHYNVGTMTRRTPNRDLAGPDCLVISPADAANERLRTGDRVLVESQYGRIEVPVRIGHEVRQGHLFLSFHFPETHANALTSGRADPKSGCPEYKVTAVRLRQARAR